MSTRQTVSRRAALKGLGTAGLAVAALHSNTGSAAEAARHDTRPVTTSAEARKRIVERVSQAPLIDTHEHLIEEKERLQGAPHPRVACDDWALLFSHYLNSDLLVAGMPKADMDRFLSAKVDPLAKWELIAPYWPAVKNTGYAQAVRIAIRELYGVDDLSADTIPRIQAGYEQTRRAGFYQRVLQDCGKIESCQVNCLTGEPF